MDFKFYRMDDLWNNTMGACRIQIMKKGIFRVSEYKTG